MKKTVLFLLVAALSTLSAATIQQGRAYMDEKCIENTQRWADTMANFRRWDSKNSFPSDAVLFIGSSSINGWATSQYFPSLPVINRGFGGSVYADIIYWADTLIKPYNPKLVVYYSGDNDPLRGKSPETIAEDFKMVYSITKEMYPDVPVIVMATKLSESRMNMAEGFTKANSLLKDFADQTDKLYYFDSATLLLDDEGNPDPKLFKSDKLHLSDEGYQIWADNLEPLIKSLLN